MFGRCLIKSTVTRTMLNSKLNFQLGRNAFRENGKLVYQSDVFL